MDAALKRTKLVLVRDLIQAARAVNDVAAEHVLVLLSEPDAFLEKIRNAGAIFLGHWSAVPFGDYGIALEPRPADGRHREVRERAARVRLRHAVLRSGDVTGIGRALRGRHGHDRPSRGPRRPREGHGGQGRRGRQMTGADRARASATWLRTCHLSSTSSRD